jgi:hypothetical protein
MSGWGKLVSLQKDHKLKGRDGASVCGSQSFPFGDPRPNLFIHTYNTQHQHLLIYVCQLIFTMRFNPPEHSDCGAAFNMHSLDSRSRDLLQAFPGTIFASYRPMPPVHFSCVHLINRVLNP